ncbi:MAG: phosphoribosyltransferase [Candidatus Bathyarchaeota archaeon]
MSKIFEFNLTHPTWEEIQGLSEILASKIVESGFRPALIVAVSRGGFDPARILCDQLDVRRLASVQIEYYTGIGNKRASPEIIYPLNADIERQKVLVVDDVSDTGESLKVARDHVVQGGAHEVRVATLHVKPWTGFRPDYYAAETEAWIVYPWEPMESIRSIAARLEEDGLDPDGIREKLKELGFAQRLLERMG